MAERPPLPPNPAVQALRRLLQRLAPVSTESIDWSVAAGRVLAEPVCADRDSPPQTVSAMDGYACRLHDVMRAALEVAGEVRIGAAPIDLPPGKTLRIFTGGCVPRGAELVIRREDVEESPDRIVIRDPRAHRAGDALRYQGENVKAGAPVLPGGTLLHAPAVAALTSLGHCRPQVFRRVRLSVVVTGDELLPPEAQPEPWQLRDSNGPAVLALFGALPWLQLQAPRRSPDHPSAITAALADALRESDAVILTGGVSMGDHDYVPAAVRQVGGDVVFHRLPIRPGRPILGAVTGAGQVIFGLPGNPVSVMVTARRFASAALRRRAGFADPDPAPVLVRAEQPLKQAAGLWWYHAVERCADGSARAAPSRGSGDIAGAAGSAGFVEVLPAEVRPDSDLLPFWPWNL